MQHSFGWPLDWQHRRRFVPLPSGRQSQVAVGFVLHLNYKNPYLSPFEEFQRFKTHPSIAPTFKDGKRIAYGARAITEGGYQSVPKLTFPGGALIGCSAGFVNVPRIKGSHNAMLSGMQAAEHVAAAIADGRSADETEPATRQRLARKRNRQGSQKSPQRQTACGLEARDIRRCGGLGGFDMWTNTLFGFSVFGTMKHGKADYAALEPASQHQKIDYPKPDGVLTFDRLSSVFLSNTNHEEDEPVHLQLQDARLQKSSEHDVFAGPSTPLLSGWRL